MKTSMPRIFLVGPDIFRRDAPERGEELKRMCAAYEAEGLYPLDGDPPHDPIIIRRHCIAMIRNADALVADISPFMDPGTAWEIGFAEAIGKPVFLWSSDTRPMIERIVGELDIDHGTLMRDADGMLVEDHGSPENLMIAHSQSFVCDRPEQAIDQAAAFLEEQAATQASIKAGWRRMRTIAAVVLAVVLATMAMIVWAHADIHVIDGDTIIVDREHIRIIGLDAPETRNAKCNDELRRGLEAKARLIDELSAACGPPAKAPTDRPAAVARPLQPLAGGGHGAGQGCVAATLINAGLARAYVYGTYCPKRQSWCGG